MKDKETFFGGGVDNIAKQTLKQYKPRITPRFSFIATIVDMETVCKTIEDLEKETDRFSKTLVQSDKRATLVTLSGELGAGKTAFTKALAKTFGITDRITSPTFVLEKAYAIPEQNTSGFTQLIHIDAYRLKNSEELATIDFGERMSNPKNLILLEWPECVKNAIPPTAVSIKIEILPDDSRKISYE